MTLTNWNIKELYISPINMYAVTMTYIYDQVAHNCNKIYRKLV